MRPRYMIIIALLLLGVVSVSPNLALSQTRLGLHVTEEELNIWKQRAISGPYKSKGDVSTNSPGDWSDINNRANTFNSNPSAHRWPGQITDTCVVADSTTFPSPNPVTSRTLGEPLMSAAFRYLLQNSATDLNNVVTELLWFATQPGLDFTNTSRWCRSGVSNDSHPYFDIANWLVRIAFAYDYVRADMSSGDRAKVEAWLLGAGQYFQNTNTRMRQTFFVDPDNGNYTLTSFGNSERSAGCRVIYMNSGGSGFSACNLQKKYNNRMSELVVMFTMAGIITGDESLKAQGARWVEELIKYSLYPDGTFSELERWLTSAPTQGWRYAMGTLGNIVTIADALCRAGDCGLYNFSTTVGIDATAGGPKTLQSIINNHYKYVDLSVSPTRYGTNNAVNNGDINYRIDTIDGIDGQGSVRDIYLAPANIFYKSAFFKSIYTRTAANAPAYPSTPEGGGYYVWGGTSGKFPGMLFMFGQTEEQVSPHANTAINPNPSQPSSKPIGYWKFDEATGTVANDSSGTGNHAILLNGVAWTTGKSGSAVSLDGLDDFVKIATTNFSTSQGTFTAWLKAPFYKSGTQYLFGHTSIPAYGNRIQLYTDDIGGGLDMGLGSSHTSAVNIQQLQTNTWNHVSLTWNSGTYGIYVNGIQKNTGSYSGVTSLNSYAHIGGVGNDGDPQSWNGAIDEVKVWNRALNVTELQNEYNSYQAAPPVAPATLVVRQ
jgi:hypothetical protein